MPSWLTAAVLLAALAAAPEGSAATPPGTVLRNSASVEYLSGGVPQAARSNEVALTVAPAPSSARLRILRAATGSSSVTSTAGPTACLGSAGIVTLPRPVLADGSELDPLRPLALGETATVHGGEAVFLEVVDPDQNRDDAVVDTLEIEVTSSAGDAERLRLVENAPASGVFTGYVQTAVAPVARGDCLLQTSREGELASRYVDPRNGTDAAEATALVNPAWRVFDSRSGQPVDGARVRLVDAITGAPARVLGDDGVSEYPSEIVTGAAVTDAGGTVYAFPPGVFRFPLVAAGRYRLEVTAGPGRLFPSEATPGQISALPGGPFRLQPASFGGAFEVAGAVPAALDVPVDPSDTALFLTKGTTAATVAIGDFVQYTLGLQNAAQAGTASDVRVADQLPHGLRYRPGSARLDGRPAADPEVDATGSLLTFRLGELPPSGRLTLTYVTEVTAGARGRDLVNTARAVAAGGIESNDASVSIRLRDELFRATATLVGRVHSGGCGDAGAAPGVAGVRIYLEDGRYVVTDADGRYHFEGLPPGTHVVQLDTLTLPEGLSPAPCASVARHAGRAFSQFVDLRGGALWRADFALDGTRAPETVAATLPSGPVLPAARGWDPDRLSPGVALLEPAEGAQPAIPSLKVAVQHAPDDEVSLTLNGRAVGPLHLDGTSVGRSDAVAVTRWRGLDLRDGDNALVVELRHADGRPPTIISRTIHYAGGAVRAELDAAASVLVADGRTRPVLAFRMFDASGRPARQGTLGAYRVSAPYRAWSEVQALNDRPLMVAGQQEPTFEVDADGIARLELEPTTQSGTVTATLRFNERREQELRAWLEPDARDWILVGLAEGTVAHREIGRSMEAAAAAGLEEGLQTDERVAFFAKGRVRGEFLLTLAYDSARDREAARERLFGVIEPDAYYTLYGDATEPGYEAASIGKLYVKLERRQFYALFGDFDTGLTVTELSRYSRNLNGFKTEYGGERLALNAFVAETELGYGRDELRGDGTSGLYRLSGRRIVANSDRIRLEVRDRFRSERIVETRPLTRFLDYSIDYDRGTVFFKQPVPSRDEDFNPVWIVAEYELLEGGGRPTIAGGRVATRFAGGRAEAGASLIHEGAPGGANELAGADLRFDVGDATELRAEVATSRSDLGESNGSATAYLAQLRHVSESLEWRAYLREQQTGFGTGQQSAAEDGTRKAGAEVRARLDRHWSATTEVFAVRNLDTGAERRHFGLELRRESDGLGLGAGLRRVEDLGTSAGDLHSDLAFLRGTVDLPDGRTSLRGTAELALGGRDDSADYPSRAVAGLDYRLTPDATLFAEYEHARGGQIEADMTRVGVRATPWSRAQVTSSVGRSITESGSRVLANVGLVQGWQATERLAFDFGLDQSRTLTEPEFAQVDPAVPPASGSLEGDFTAAFAGALYRSEAWTATGRIERRDADDGLRHALSAGLYREEQSGRAFSATLRVLDDEGTAGRRADQRELTLGWAFRPLDSRWIVLNRVDWRGERQRDATLDVESQRVINNLNANLRLDPRTELGVQLGLRYVVSSFDGERYRGLSELYGLDLRRDLGGRFDAGFHGTLLRSRRSDVSDAAVGVDVGVTLADNVWLSVGYNFEGFDDEDYRASRHTSQGPYLKLRIKADQQTFRDLLPLPGLSPRTAR